MLFKSDTSRVKGGNGLGYMQHLEHEAQKRNLKATVPLVNTRDNLFYHKLRDTLVASTSRAKEVKERQVTEHNEKMYGKLIKILNAESASVAKTRNASPTGPSSLNVVTRR